MYLQNDVSILKLFSSFLRKTFTFLSTSIHPFCSMHSTCDDVNFSDENKVLRKKKIFSLFYYLTTTPKGKYAKICLQPQKVPSFASSTLHYGSFLQKKFFFCPICWMIFLLSSSKFIEMNANKQLTLKGLNIFSLLQFSG